MGLNAMNGMSGVISHPTLPAALHASLSAIYGEAALAERPCLFAATRVAVSAADREVMAAVVAAIERVLANPRYQAAVLGAALPADAPARAAGVCMGYDFHLTEDGPKLIEINTNAGGLALVADLMNAWGMPGDTVFAATLAMFRQEWAIERGDERPLRRIAIVDQAPATQFLRLEFHRFQALFEQHGIAAVVADPAELSWDAAARRLLHHGEEIDLVYNRLTDFALQEPAQAALLAAWQARAAVVTPHPLIHRLAADKRNLELLADPPFRQSLALAPADEAALAATLLPMQPVRPSAAEALWSTRKQWFFKPAAGFGSKAVYRGDKITRRVFDEVLAGDYVAQAFAAPAEQEVPGPDGSVRLKYDVRNYAYRGAVLAIAARLYQGQTTNFRTPGGGFAPIVTGKGQ